MSEVHENLRAWAEVDREAGRSVRSEDMKTAAEAVDRMHIALGEILEASDLEWAKARALVALPDR